MANELPPHLQRLHDLVEGAQPEHQDGLGAYNVDPLVPFSDIEVHPQVQAPLGTASLPEPEPYQTLPEQIPAAPTDLSTVSIAVARDVDYRDAAEYGRQYMERAQQALSEEYSQHITPDNTNAQD
jgi:hypothetical protein